MDINVRKVSTDWTTLPTGLTWYFIGQPRQARQHKPVNGVPMEPRDAY